MISSLYRHKGYIWRTALSELLTRYAGSVVGVVWNVLEPLALIAIFWTIFGAILVDRNSRVAELPGGFAVYLCAALLPWVAFSDCVQRSTRVFIAKAGYVRKLPIPEHVFVAQAAAGSAIGLVISFGLLVVVFVALGARPSVAWLGVPVALALMMGLAFGVGMALGTVNVFIRDTGQIVPIVLRLAFWAYPVVYPLSAAPGWFQKAAPFNPMYAYLESVRDMQLWGEWPPMWRWVAMVGWTAGAVVLWWVVLRSLRRELRDVV